MDVIKITRAIDWLSDVAGYIAKWLVLLACLISAGNAVVRYLISYSSNGLLEIQWYMFGGIVLLGAAQTLRLNEHVRVDLLYSAVSDRARLWIDIVGITIFLLPVTAFLTFLTWPFFAALPFTAASGWGGSGRATACARTGRSRRVGAGATTGTAASGRFRRATADGRLGSATGGTSCRLWVRRAAMPLCACGAGAAYEARAR